MQIFKISPVVFDNDLYQTTPLYITGDKVWDGGISLEDSLAEKTKFYDTASKMADTIKRLIIKLDEEVYIGECYCEHNQLYAHWSDLKKNDLFRSISAIIKKRKSYKLDLSEDNNIIDMVVEANFRYLTHMSFYFSKNNLIIQPTCHTELAIYSRDKTMVCRSINEIIEDFSEFQLID